MKLYLKNFLFFLDLFQRKYSCRIYYYQTVPALSMTMKYLCNYVYLKKKENIFILPAWKKNSFYHLRSKFGSTPDYYMKRSKSINHAIKKKRTMASSCYIKTVRPICLNRPHVSNREFLDAQKKKKTMCLVA
jgi:hypothetical protein